MFFFLILSLFFLQKNIIIFIGDGFGPEQMKMIEDNGYPWISFDGFSVLDTRNPFCGIPDSASSGTAIFSGIFTENGMIGMGINGKSYETLGEIAKEKGYSVGIITDVEIYDATPACLYAHTKGRQDKEKILEYLKNSKFDLFVGKGKEDFNGKVYPLKEDEDYLEVIKKSLNQLKSIKKPYFLLIEAGKIDWACHDNDLESLKKEVSKAKKIINFLMELTFLEKETIIFITADHETGGFDFRNSTFSTKMHTSLPVFAFSTKPFEEFLLNQPHLHRHILQFLKK